LQNLYDKGARKGRPDFGYRKVGTWLQFSTDSCELAKEKFFAT